MGEGGTEESSGVELGLVLDEQLEEHHVQRIERRACEIRRRCIGVKKGTAQ